MAETKVATWSLNLQSNAAAITGEAATELEAFRAKIEQSQISLKGLGGAMRSLRGASDEVVETKKLLKAQIEAERGAVSQANLALLKKGTTYEQLTAKMKANEAQQRRLDARRQAEDLKRIAERTTAVRTAVQATGGPVAELAGRFGTLREVISGVGLQGAALTLGLGALVAGVTALAAATVDAGFKLGKFLIASADELRSMQLMREAVAGNAENARNLGSQVDFIARKVSTSKGALNDLAVSLTKSLSGGVSRASGQAIVDTFAAVSEAAAAAGDDTGRAIREIIERGKLLGRIWTSPFELQGTGLQFQDVAGALAKRMKVSLDDARKALFEGRVGIEAGARALRDAVETKFGGINAAKLLTLDVQFQKFHEHLVGLTRGVVLEPLLRGMAGLFDKFDETSVTGKAVAAIFEKIGNAIVGISTRHIDGVVRGVETLVLWGLKAVEVFDRWGPRVLGVVEGLAQNETVVTGLKVALIGLGTVVGVAAAAITASFAPLAALIGGVGAAVYGVYRAFVFVRDLKWGELGSQIVGGIVGGIRDSAARLWDAVTGLATRIKRTFEGALEMRSPSRVFERYGKLTTEGYRRGLAQGNATTTSAATRELVPPAPSVGAGGTGFARAGGPVQVSVSFEIHVSPHASSGQAPGAMGQEIAHALTAPDVLRHLQRAIRLGLMTQGIPTQTPVGAG